MPNTINHIAKKQARKKSGKATSYSSPKAKREAKKIINALKEAEQVHKGKRKGKTLDEFLGEL
jgi:hypothetical protein